MSKARVKVIGIWRDDAHELRFVREGDEWRPDLFINHETGVVSAPPTCFKPKLEITAALDEAMLQSGLQATGAPSLRLELL